LVGRNGKRSSCHWQETVRACSSINADVKQVNLYELFCCVVVAYEMLFDFWRNAELLLIGWERFLYDEKVAN